MNGQHSQESDILDEETYRDLASQMNIEGLMGLQYDSVEEPEHKFDINLLHQLRDDMVMNFQLEHELLQQQQQQHMQQQQLLQQYSQTVTAEIPVKDVFPGMLNFQLLVTHQMGEKNWVYSSTLEKVFIKMEETLPLRFRWEPPHNGLFLRTTTVYSLEQFQSDPVQRCHNHMAPSNHSNLNISQKQMKHVVRCMHPHCLYEEKNGHLSVRVPLGMPQAGSQYVPMHFQFFCKNSCTSGMNRRSTELIFTLENDQGEVLGRRKLLVRVCSCPKRDKSKEEKESRDKLQVLQTKKRKMSVPIGKKLVSNSLERQPYNIQLKIIGKENCIAILKYAYDRMAGDAVQTDQLDSYKPYLDELLRNKIAMVNQCNSFTK